MSCDKALMQLQKCVFALWVFRLILHAITNCHADFAADPLCGPPPSLPYQSIIESSVCEILALCALNISAYIYIHRQFTDMIARENFGTSSALASLLPLAPFAGTLLHQGSCVSCNMPHFAAAMPHGVVIAVVFFAVITASVMAHKL